MDKTQEWDLREGKRRNMREQKDFCNKNKEDPRRGKGSTKQSTGKNKEICE